MDSTLAWVWGNKEWLFSGIGVAMIGGLIALWRVRYHRSHVMESSSVSPEVKIPDSTTVAQVLSRPAEHVALPTLRDLTPSAIRKTLADAPLLIQPDIATHYRGVRVQWQGRLSSMSKRETMLRLYVECDPHHSVFLNVDPKHYPGLGLLRRGDIVKFEGTIEEVHDLWIVIADAQILP